MPAQALAADREARSGAAARAEAVLGVAPHLWPVVQLFDALHPTQWCWLVGAAGAQRIGLRYEAVPAAARLLGLRLTPRAFAQLRLMEREALRALSAPAAVA